MATTDELTGLLNRSGFFEWFRHARAVWSGEPPGDGTRAGVLLVAVDLEDFAGINVEYGQAGGDSVLQEVARRLEHLAGDTGAAARVAGNTFVLGARRTAAAADELGAAIVEALRQPVELDGRAAVASGNVAIAATGVDEPMSALVRRLELALDRARRAPGPSVVVADELEADRFSAALVADLSTAVARDEVRVHYLPIVSLSEGTVVGVEALARWHRADEVLDAAQFIELALKTGSIVQIGRHVMEQACRDVGRWTAEHQDQPPVRLCLNISLHQLLEPDAVSQIVALLDSSGLAADQLCLEMSENSLSDLGEAVGPTLEALKAIGLRLSVDDFGTGSSSLIALQRHRFDELKVDRSFIRNMDGDAGAAALVRGIIRLARSLGLEVVAEGIERPAQEQMLRSLRCHAGQGWLYARPNPHLGEAIDQARTAARLSLERRPVDHRELWSGMGTVASAARFVEAVFETAPIGMVLIDRSGAHLAANPAAGTVLGHEIGELLRQTAWELVHPADLQADLRGLDELLGGQRTSYVVEERVIGADGAMRWVEVTVSGIPGEHQAHGEPTRLLRQVRSLEADQQAKADAAVLRSIVASSPDALIITDARARCTHWNPAAARLFGWTEDEMVGQPLTRLVSGADHLALARVLGEAAGGSLAARWADATWFASDGCSLAVDVTFGPILGDEGAVVGLVALARDVAHQRAAEASLREAHRALECRAGDLAVANDRLGAFAATLSHDLLQPVAALDGFLMMLDKYALELDEEHRDWLWRAIRGKDRIVEAIGALHRSVLADELPLTRVELAPVLADLVVELAGVGSTDIVEVGILPTVMGDPGLIGRAFANLLQNALRYRRDDRPLRIQVEAMRDGAAWVVSVTDTGRGIDPAELETVFERGIRGSSSVGTDGTGTGLATVRAVLQRMGGDAWAEPHDGGARICLRLRAATTA
jgi:PAS domain S-box-containing protein/diguanylate cyclase (GGDEF)-like protein